MFRANFLRRRRVFEKTGQKSRFWALFGKFLQKNRVCFGAHSPSKLVYIGAKGTFRKILGSVGQKRISQKVSKGEAKFAYLCIFYKTHQLKNSCIFFLILP